MSNFSIQFFPANAGSGDYLGGGYIRSGVLSAKFGVFKNDKFSQGFAISLPRKQVQGKWIDEVSFLNKEESDAVYAEVQKHISGSLKGNSQSAPQRSASAPKDKATSVSRNQPQKGAGVPEELPF